MASERIAFSAEQIELEFESQRIVALVAARGAAERAAARAGALAARSSTTEYVDDEGRGDGTRRHGRRAAPGGWPACEKLVPPGRLA